ncbi:hypothetical protein [Oricola thermophila]|uniref:Uncharacterized protein n=1 Tax=Oricola thermophila TaxID=2742145 RepID=A0A6N1VDV1_9HYPH|nr:hypothetical protein [Oricola thermophila]QKV18713.1 hypothetical protein HTY61_09755 [Oricola thermophila]
MPTTYPVAFPDIAGAVMRPARFRLSDTVSMLLTNSGVTSHARVATPVWTLSLGVDFETVQAEEDFDRFIQSVRDALGSVIVGQYGVFCRPRNHSSGMPNASAADTTGLVASTEGLTVDIVDVDPNLSLAEADLVGFEKDGARGLGILQEASPPGSSSRTLTLRPAPRGPAFAAGATVRFVDPKLKMRIAAASYSPATGYFGSASLDLVEVAI